MSHARVAPSGLHLTVPCPGSLQLQEKAPPLPMTEEEEEGHVAHAVAQAYAQGNGSLFPRGRKIKIPGGTRDWEIDDDMIDGALMYKHETSPAGRFEDAVRCQDVDDDSYGTPDYWQSMSLPLLKVMDYKYGHRYVEVFENYQTISYTAGVGRFLQLPPETPVRLGIVQPRAFHRNGPVRIWDNVWDDVTGSRPLMLGDIYAYIARYIRPRVALALGPNPPTHPGRHCLDCKARHMCEALRRTDAHIFDYVGTTVPDDLDNYALGRELRIIAEAKKLLEARETGLFARADALARAGMPIAFWSLQPKGTRLKWLDNTSVEEVASMAKILGYDVLKPPALITPTQAKDKGIDEAIIMQYADRPSGGFVLKPDDSTALRKAFGVPQR